MKQIKSDDTIYLVEYKSRRGKKWRLCHYCFQYDGITLSNAEEIKDRLEEQFSQTTEYRIAKFQRVI